MNIIAHICSLIHTANGVLMQQRRVLGISVTHSQWLDCLAYVFAVNDGECVTEYCADKPELQTALQEAWEYYDTI